MADRDLQGIGLQARSILNCAREPRSAREIASSLNIDVFYNLDNPTFFTRNYLSLVLKLYSLIENGILDYEDVAEPGSDEFRETVRKYQLTGEGKDLLEISEK